MGFPLVVMETPEVLPAALLLPTAWAQQQAVKDRLAALAVETPQVAAAAVVVLMLVLLRGRQGRQVLAATAQTDWQVALPEPPLLMPEAAGAVLPFRLLVRAEQAVAAMAAQVVVQSAAQGPTTLEAAAAALRLVAAPHITVVKVATAL
jgi:hypothetical protein